MRAHKYRLLVVDGDAEQFSKLKEFLGDEFYCELVSTPAKALVNLQKKYYDAILSEIEFGDINGVSLLENIRKNYLNYCFVFFSKGEIKPANAIKAIQNQVNGFLLKPIISKESVMSLIRLLNLTKLPLKRLQTSDYKIENVFHIIIPGSEQDIINAMEIADQMTNVLYPEKYGDFADLKICLYEALSNAKLYGSASTKNKINLRIEFKDDRIACHIKDQGKGFMHKNVSDKMSSVSTYSGIKLIASLMDDFSFNSSGNEVNFIKLLNREPEKTAAANGALS